MPKVTVTIAASFLPSQTFTAEVFGSGSVEDVAKAESEALSQAGLYLNEELVKRIPEGAGKPGPEKPEGEKPPEGGFQK